MSLLNFPNVQRATCTLMSIASGGSAFTYIPPQTGVIGLAFFSVAGGIEISALGLSSSAQGFTVVGGVTSVFNYINSQAPVLNLAPYGSGFPIPVSSTMIAQPLAIAGNPGVWLSSTGSSAGVRVMTFFNDAYGNI